MNTLKVSVIVPTKSRPQKLLRCLRSLDRQNRLPDEVLVGVETDDTESLEFLRGYWPQHIRSWSLIEVSAKGKVASVNAQLEKARGDILFFTDDDAEPDPEWIERLVKHFDDERVAAAGGRDCLYIGQHLDAPPARDVGKVSWYGRSVGNHHCQTATLDPFEVDVLKGVNMSVRRSLMSGLDPRLRGSTPIFEENDTCLRLRRQGYRIIFDPRARVCHYPVSSPDFVTVRERRFNPKYVFNLNHNEMYVNLKHLTRWGKWAYLVFTFVIGTSATLGLVRVLWGLVVERQTRYPKVFMTAIRGKIAGIQSYREFKRR